jgi:hypothetical protein
MTDKLYVLVDHNQKIIIDHIRYLPENWNNIHGLKHLDDTKLENLNWAGYDNMGWIKITDERLSEYSHTEEWLNMSLLGFKNQVANSRWEKEGEILEFNGMQIKLSDRTLNSLNSIKLSISNDEVINWKFINGFKNLTYEEFLNLHSFVMSYIKKCFEEEKRLIDLYDSIKTIDEFISEDFSHSWPSTVYSE